MYTTLYSGLPGLMALDKQVMEGLNNETDIGKEPTAHQLNVFLNVLRERKLN